MNHDSSSFNFWFDLILDSQVFSGESLRINKENQSESKWIRIKDKMIRPSHKSKKKRFWFTSRIEIFYFWYNSANQNESIGFEPWSDPEMLSPEEKDGVILWSRDIAKSLRFNLNVRSGENVGSANVSLKSTKNILVIYKNRKESNMQNQSWKNNTFVTLLLRLGSESNFRQCQNFNRLAFTIYLRLAEKTSKFRHFVPFCQNWSTVVWAAIMKNLKFFLKC